MLKIIIDILSLDNHYGVSKEVDIAKGVNKYTTNSKEIYRQKLRKYKAVYNG